MQPKKAQVQPGVYAFKRTGAKYYARQKSDGVWLYKGTRPTFTAYCGVLTVERFLLEYEKAT